MDHLFNVWAVFNLGFSRMEPQKGPLRKSLIFILTLVQGKIKMQQEEENKIKLPYLSSLEERWMCGLPLGNEGL